jgi:hypothetical protein
MYIPKKYGQGKVDSCPFCAKTATAKNSQNVPVCVQHKEETLDDLKCLCGEYLDILEGKYGVFFKCIKCGNMNLRKVLEFNTIKPKQKPQNPSTDSSKPYMEKRAPKYSATSYSKPSQKKEITVRSDDPRYFS